MKISIINLYFPNLKVTLPTTVCMRACMRFMCVHACTYMYILYISVQALMLIVLVLLTLNNKKCCFHGSLVFHILAEEVTR
jgi:hypothetical protein